MEHKRASQYRVADAYYDSQLLAALKNACTAHSIAKVPRLIIYRSGENMQASYDAKADSLYITENYTQGRTQGQLESVFGHELGHKKQRWGTLISTRALRLGRFVAAVAIAVPVARLFGAHQTRQIPLDQRDVLTFLGKAKHFMDDHYLTDFAAYAVVHALLRKPFNYLSAAVARLKERDADRQSVKHVQKPEAWISTLKKSTDYNKELREKRTAPIHATDLDKQEMLLVPPKEKESSWLKKLDHKLMRTHPAFEQRQASIRAEASKRGITTAIAGRD